MKLIHLADMTPELWFEAWEVMYSPYLGDHMGVDPNLTASRPSLSDFYRNIMAAHEAGRFEAWAIVTEDGFKGYTLLDKSVGEWEVGSVLADPSDWNSGIGVRATLHALKWAFEEDESEWVVAFTQGKDPNVPRILRRGGFRPLFNYHVMDRDTWNARWAGRVK